MTQDTDAPEPDWESPLQLALTPALLIHALMTTASAVHTGWSSCIDDKLVVADVLAMDDAGSYVRLVEQEFYEDEDPETVWHDWTLEIRVGKVLTTGHWQIPTNAPPMEWDFNGREAQLAFEKACVLIGRRVRRGVSVEEPPRGKQPPPRTSRH